MSNNLKSTIFTVRLLVYKQILSFNKNGNENRNTDENNHDNINNTWETPMLITDEIQYFKAQSQIQSKNNIEL